MAPTRSLNVQVTGDARSLNRVLDTTESRTKRWGGAMAKGFAVAGAAAAGGLAVGLKKSAEAAVEAEKTQARLEAQLRASGISYRAHAKQIDEVIQKHSRLSGLDDEDLTDAFTNIVRVTGDMNQSLRLTGLAADFARAKHLDVAKAGELVAKVAGGNTGILSRYGFQLKDGATAQEALAAMQKRFAGQAEAYGKTTAGAMDRASVASENLGEMVGARLTPWLAKAANAMVDVLEAVEHVWPKVRRTVGSVVNAVVGFVRKFRDRNREDIAAVVEAVQRVGRAFQRIFQDIVLPAVQRVLPGIKAALGGIVQAVRGVVRIVSGLINGDWSRIWSGVKDIVRGALKAAVGVIKAVGGLVLDAVKGLGKAIIRGLVNALSGLAGAIKNAVVSNVKKGVSAASGAVSDIIGKINPFGDGIGRAAKSIAGDGLGFMGGSAGASGAGLRGADFDLAPFARIGAGMGLSVSSGLRPGSITSSGNRSYHASGDAIDMAGAPGQMMRFAKTMRTMFGSRLRELIYTPMGIGIKDGRPYQYSGQVAQDHYDHVHVAYTGPFGDGIGQIRNLWTRAGGSASKANMAAAIAMAESSGDPGARNVNTDGSVDRGLWQINSVHGALSTFDRMGNARAAVRISGNGRNWNPWVTFKTGAYRRFLSGGSGGGSSRPRPMSPAEAFRQSQDNASESSAAGVRNARLGPGAPAKGGARTGPAKGWLPGQFPGVPEAPGGTGGESDEQRALREAIEANTRAQEEHKAALDAVAAEIKRNGDIAESAIASDNYQLWKWIADGLSGQLGRAVVGRGFTPGTGVEVAY